MQNHDIIASIKPSFIALCGRWKMIQAQKTIQESNCVADIIWERFRDKDLLTKLTKGSLHHNKSSSRRIAIPITIVKKFVERRGRYSYL